MKRIKKMSEQLNDDPQFASFDDMINIIGYRAADRMVSNRNRQIKFDEKLGKRPLPVGKFWKKL